MDEQAPKKVFYERTFSMLVEAADAVAAEVPEVEAVVCVVLWRLPDQRNVPSAVVRGADGPVVNPDQFLRIRLAVLQLEQYLAEKGLEGVAAIRELASNLAKEARRDAQQADERRREQAGTAAQAAGRGEDG